MKHWVTFLLFTQVLSYIRIFSPPDLHSKFLSKYPLGHIHASLGNFGNPLYGRTLTGQVIIEHGNNSKACLPLSPILTESSSSFILLVDRGDCAFVTKVRHCQNLGAKAVLIVDDTDEEIDEFIMSDNGSAGNLEIPAMLISKEDGTALKEYAGSARISEIVITINFEVNKSMSNNLDLVVYMTSASEEAMKLLVDLGDYIHFFPNIKFTPHYFIFQCGVCRDSGFHSRKNECLGGGRYCNYDADGSGKLEGRDSVIEDLRQICVHKEVGWKYDRWFRYIKGFYPKCFVDLDKNCIKEAMKNAGISYDNVQKCIEDSVEGHDIYVDDNSIMRKELEWYKREKIPFNPALIINNLVYRGDMEVETVLAAMCAGYYTEYLPDYCRGDKRQSFIIKARESWVLVVVVLIIFLAVIILACYRMVLRRDLKRDMKIQVGAAVSSYFQLSELS